MSKTLICMEFIHLKYVTVNRFCLYSRNSISRNSSIWNSESEQKKKIAQLARLGSLAEKWPNRKSRVTSDEVVASRWCEGSREGGFMYATASGKQPQSLTVCDAACDMPKMDLDPGSHCNNQYFLRFSIPILLQRIWIIVDREAESIHHYKCNFSRYNYLYISHTWYLFYLNLLNI